MSLAGQSTSKKSKQHGAGDDVWSRIASVLSVTSLGRLACVERRFSHANAIYGKWSIIDEGSRHQIEYHFARAPHTRGWIPRRPNEHWLNLLHELNRLRARTLFDPLRTSIDVFINTGSTADGSSPSGMMWKVGDEVSVFLCDNDDDGDYNEWGDAVVLSLPCNRTSHLWEVQTVSDDEIKRCTANEIRQRVHPDSTWAMCHSHGPQAAVTEVPMRAGRHYAEFTQLDGGWPGTEQDVDGLGEMSGTAMGVVGAGFIVTERRDRPIFFSGRPCASASQHGWMFQTCEDGGDVRVGEMGHNLGFTTPGPYRETPESACLTWPGKPTDFTDRGGRSLSDGDVVGLLLDVDKGSLAVYLNGIRCGIMMQKGGLFKNHKGGVPADLKPPLWWAVDVGYSSKISIISKPPPVVTDQDRADDTRKATELLARQEARRRKFGCEYMYD